MVEGIELEIEAPNPAAIIGGMGLNPAPIASEVAIGQTITAEAVFEATYNIEKVITALIANIPHSVESAPIFSAIKSPNSVARPLASIPRPNIKPPPKRIMMFQSIDFKISFHDNMGCHDFGKRFSTFDFISPVFCFRSTVLLSLILTNPINNIINMAGMDSGMSFMAPISRSDKPLREFTLAFT